MTFRAGNGINTIKSRLYLHGKLFHQIQALLFEVGATSFQPEFLVFGHGDLGLFVVLGAFQRPDGVNYFKWRHDRGYLYGSYLYFKLIPGANMRL